MWFVVLIGSAIMLNIAAPGEITSGFWVGMLYLMLLMTAAQAIGNSVKAIKAKIENSPDELTPKNG